MNGLKLRIGFIMSIFMIGTALVIDGLKAFIELITFGVLGWAINPFINFWGQLTFFFWFTYLGVSFFKPGKMQGAKIASMAIPSIIGLLPWIDALPFWTSGVIINLAAVYAEDLVEPFSTETIKNVSIIINKIKK